MSLANKYTFVDCFPFLHWQCAENMELQQKVDLLQQQLSSGTVQKLSLSSEQGVSEDYIDELKKKVQSQVLTRIFAAFEWADFHCPQSIFFLTMYHQYVLFLKIK